MMIKLILFCFLIKIIESLDLQNIGIKLGVESCLNRIETESKCHQKYLSSLSWISDKPGPEQDSDDYKWKVCCSIWKWQDCVLNYADDALTGDGNADINGGSGSQCNSQQLEILSSFHQQTNNPYHNHCIDFPKNSIRCWEFPWWAMLLCILTGVLLIALGSISYFYWNNKRVYQSRGYQKRTAL